MKKVAVLLFIVVLAIMVGATDSTDVSAKSKKQKYIEKLEQIIEKVKDTVGPTVTKVLQKIVKKYEAGKISFKKALKKIKAKIKEVLTTPISLDQLQIPPILSEATPSQTKTLPCPNDIGGGLVPIPLAPDGEEDGLIPIPLAPNEETVYQLC